MTLRRESTGDTGRIRTIPSAVPRMTGSGSAMAPNHPEFVRQVTTRLIGRYGALLDRLAEV